MQFKHVYDRILLIKLFYIICTHSYLEHIFSPKLKDQFKVEISKVKNYEIFMFFQVNIASHFLTIMIVLSSKHVFMMALRDQSPFHKGLKRLITLKIGKICLFIPIIDI